MSAKKDDAEKKKSWGFSLTDAEIDAIDDRAKAHHHFRNRAEYLLALLEADEHYGLRRDVERLRIARKKSPIEEAMEERTRHDEWRNPTVNEGRSAEAGGVKGVSDDTPPPKSSGSGSSTAYPTRGVPRRSSKKKPGGGR